MTDILTSLERISDHCSNIAGCVEEIDHDSLGLHAYSSEIDKIREVNSIRFIHRTKINMQLTRIKLGLLQIKERRLILCIQFMKNCGLYLQN